MNRQILRSNDLKQVENILFYAASSVRPPREGLENILENLPVTKYHDMRYISVMGAKIAIPLGIVAIALIAFVFVGNFGKDNTVKELPATITKDNVDSSLNKIDSSVSTSMDELDQNLKDLDHEDKNEDLNDL